MYSRDFGGTRSESTGSESIRNEGIRSEGQLYNLEREYNEARAREEYRPQPQFSSPPHDEHGEKRGLKLDFIRNLKLDDLILIGIGLLLLLDSDQDNDIFVIILAFLLML